MTLLDERIAERILDKQSELLTAEKLFPKKKLDELYSTFRERFAPEKLQQMDGKQLLEAMHDHSNTDSLVYWLEFKNDDDFPAIFGSIAGGSALKFIVFRRAETGEWETRGEENANKPVVISEEEAIDIARKNRDQLVRGARLIGDLPDEPTQDDYRQLEEDMKDQAPDVSRLAWGHKYFSLLYPHCIDDFHNVDYQHFYLIKMLIEPPEDDSRDARYLPAWYYRQAREKLEIPMNHLTAILGRVYGRPHQYWRVGTQEGDTRHSHWDVMRDGEYVSIGWSELGDLSDFAKGTEVEEHFKQEMTSRYDHKPTLTRLARQVRRFANVGNYDGFLSVGDIVLAMSGQTVLGIGRVSGDYQYVEEDDFPHHRPVEWLSLEEWTMPENEGLRYTCYKMKKVDNFIETERRILDAPDLDTYQAEPGIRTTEGKKSLPSLGDYPAHIKSILDRKKQVILYGPPGTGKTFWGQKTANELAARSVFRQTYDDLTSEQVNKLEKYVRFCSFHPAYGYEDFLEGYRPEVLDGEMAFEKRDGIFKQICLDAIEQPEMNFYLLIDEINRGDIPRIFGELMTLLEADKRGQSMLLPLTGESFRVPPNVYLIGTMNTADRSIALLDTALRRRFGFIEFMPDNSLLAEAEVERIPVDLWLRELNKRIVQHVGRDARNLQIGHAYLMHDGQPIRDFEVFRQILREDIIPLLEEYCYEDYATLESILGRGLVDREKQRINDELFEPAQQDNLIQALLAPAPEIMSTGRAIEVEEEAESEVQDGIAEDDDDLEVDE